MTEVQRILLARLRLEFDVDTSPAEGLEGVALDAWIDRAERDLLIALKVDAKS